MNVHIVTPAPRGSNSGNRVTAERWARIICTLGHRVRVATDYKSESCDMLIALHARKSAGAVARLRSRSPGTPVVVCLTGTDLYGDIQTSKVAQRTLELATRLVVLHPKASEQLPNHLRDKVCVIRQSANRQSTVTQQNDQFTVCVLGHLRHVKDPFRAAMATRRLPADSRIRVVLVGAALSDSMRRRAEGEQEGNTRFVWLGEQPRAKALRILASSDAVVLSSRSEGGANVISEAIMSTVPLLASRIPSSTDLLGEDYPGLFNVGDTAALQSLMLRLENDHDFRTELRSRLSQLQHLFHPRLEADIWRGLLVELVG